MRPTMFRLTLISLVAALLILGALPTAPAGAATPPSGRMSRLVKGPIVTPFVKHDVSPPLRRLKAASVSDGGQRVIPLRRTNSMPAGKANRLKAFIQPHVAPRLPTLSNAFAGIGVTGFIPPDTNGAVGPRDYVQIVNASFAVFNKDPARGTVGSIRYGPVANNTLWSGIGGPCETNNDGDPSVVYDGIANRWVITQFAIRNTPTYYECLAVSTGSDPTGSYYRYVAAYTNFNDYPKLAVWPDAYYMTFNLFQSLANPVFQGVEACAFDRAAMLVGAAANQVCFILPNTLPGSGSLLPATLDGSRLPPAGAPDYLLSLESTASLAFWSFHVDFATPANSALTGPTGIAVAAFAPACNAWSAGGGTCIPQPGTTQQLDSVSDRLMYRLAYRNFGGNESLVVDHAVTVGSSVGMRWYEIRSPGTTPTLYQEGTYAPDANYRWMGSIAEDRFGDMALGYSLSSGTVFPSVALTGRLLNDALGTLPQGEEVATAGNGSQTGTFYPSRWGDYSSMAVDPSDDCTFWYTNEYLPSNGDPNWQTSIVSFAYPSCISGPAPTPTPVATATPTATPTFTPTPTPTPTAIPTATPTPIPPTPTPVTGNIVRNGGFEAGTANWTEYSYGGQQTIYASPQARSGAQAFFPCGYAACDDRVAQTIMVPTTLNSATLSYWLRSFSALGTLPGALCLDQFSATLATPDGTVISGTTLQPLCETVATGGYVLETFDVTSLLQAYAGQQVILTLRGTTANVSETSAITQWSVDDVSLLIS